MPNDRQRPPRAPPADRDQRTASIRAPRRPGANRDERTEIVDADPELAQQLGDRSPEEIYGDDEPSALPSQDLRAGRTGVSQAATQAKPGPPVAEPSQLSRQDSSPDATRAGPPLKLVIVGGPDEGKERKFHGVRLVVGRVKDCDLVLSDESVSRRHLELIVSEKGVLLRDLGSGNGTKVNGERVTERRLDHEDVIALGHTKLKFVDETEAVRRVREEAQKKEAAERQSEEEAKAAAEAAARAAEGDLTAAQEAAAALPPAPGDLRGQLQYRREQALRWARALPLPLQIGGAVIVALLFLLLLVIFVHGSPPQTAAHHRALEQLDLARKAMAEGRSQEASDLIALAQRQDPEEDIRQRSAALRDVLEAKLSMDKAQRLLADSRFDDAQAELARTPRADDASQARHRQLRSQLELGRRDFHVHAARDAMARGDFAAAQREVALAPVELRPGLLNQLAQQQKAAQVVQAQQEEQARIAQRKLAEHQAEARRAFVNAAFAGVLKRMGEEDFTRAALECDRVADRFQEDPELRSKANAVKRAMPLLARDYNDAKMKLASHFYDGAVRSLRHARELMSHDMGLEGAFSGRLDGMLSTALLGVAKIDVGDGGDLVGAAQAYREVLRLTPGNDPARQGLDQLAAQADQLLAQGLRLRDTSPKVAAAKLMLARDISAPGSPTHSRAKRALAGLSP